MTPDCELLRRYADQGDEAAFAEVVACHVDLVYSAALRLVGGDAHLAQDVAQGVFTALARRARSLAKHASIAGWLYTTTRYTAGNLRRGQHRRFAREQEAYAMNQPAHSSEIDWDALQPVLDEAVCALGSTDREAVLLRFFQNKSHREVGDALGLGEDAARKRVDRALEKLRAHFARRGVVVSAGVLAAEIGANSVQAAPVGLAESLTGTSLAGAGATAEGIFIKIFLMNAKTKLFTAAAIILIAVIIGIGFWLFSQPTAATPMSAKDSQSKRAIPVAEVEMPQLPPAAPSLDTSNNTPSAATAGFPPGRREEIASAIQDMIARLKAGDTQGVFNDYTHFVDDTTPSEEQDVWRGLMEKYHDELIAQLESLQTSLPAITPQYRRGISEDLYFFYWTDPVTHQHEQFAMMKGNGHWMFDVNILGEWDRESRKSDQP